MLLGFRGDFLITCTGTMRKLSNLLKWLTLPIIASTITITCVPANYQETS